MSTSGRTATADAAGELAGAIRAADFVHLVAAADGDALAAAGLIARGCRASDVPFQASVARTDDERDRRLAVAEGGASRSTSSDRGSREHDDLTVLVGDHRGAADQIVAAREHPASATAHAVATDLGADPAPTVALSGAFAAGVQPGAGATAGLLDAARASDLVDRRPGVALPIGDVAVGLTHQTLVHADFAGDPDRAADLARDAGFDAGRDAGEVGGDAGGVGSDAESDVDDVEHVPENGPESGPDEADHKRLASLVALAAAGHERAVPRAADAVERALRPYATPNGPFATVGGYADVLEATARVAPGIGVALALEGSVRDGALRGRALAAWRDHGRAAHAAVRSASTDRHEGLFVATHGRDAGVDGAVPVETAARLVLDALSPEPAVLFASEGAAGAAAVAGADVHVGDAMRETVAAFGGEAGGDHERAYATHDADADAFVTAFREAVP